MRTTVFVPRLVDEIEVIAQDIVDGLVGIKKRRARRLFLSSSAIKQSGRATSALLRVPGVQVALNLF